jgi:hypothetical protein
VTYPSTAFADQRTDAQKEAVDFIFHKESTPHSKSLDTPVELKFKHKFSKIRIRVLQDAGGPSCAAATATLTGMPTSATVDLVKLINGDPDAITPGTPGTILPNLKSSNAGEAIFEAIIPPHLGTAYTSRKLEFNNGGTAYSYPLDDNTFDFVSEREYKFDLTLRANGAPLDMSDNLTNCYIVAKNGSVTIPITRAITVGGMSETEPATVGVEWDDNAVIKNISTFSGSNAARTFNVSVNNVLGNAVVSLKGSDGTIYWSWHIWVNGGNGSYYNNGYTIMDRNLGATAADRTPAAHGLLYQWGRKDPFPGSGTAGAGTLSNFHGMPDAADPSTKTIDAALGVRAAITMSIQNPTTFFTNGIGWGGETGKSWNTSSNQKSVYDPCPPTWRMPKKKSSVTTETLELTPWYNYTAQTTYTSGDKGTIFTNGDVYATYMRRRHDNAALAFYGNYSPQTCPKLGYMGELASNGAIYLISMYTGVAFWDYNWRSAAGAAAIRCVRM